MSYRVSIPVPVRTRIGTLGLTNFVLVEVLQRLSGLAVNPAAQLVLAGPPFDCMTLVIELVDPDDRMCVHVVIFPVYYSSDESTLHIGHPTYRREVG